MRVAATNNNATAHWGLIAGNGDFPFLVLEGARSRGIEMAVIAIREEASPALERTAKRFHWVSLGELSRTIELLHQEGVKHAVMAGQVKHNKIFSSIRPDWKLAKVLLSLKSKNTDSLIGAVANVLEDEGIELVDSTAFLGPLLPAPGVLTRRAPDESEAADIDYGRHVAAANCRPRPRPNRRDPRPRLRGRRSHGRNGRNDRACRAHRRRPAPRRRQSQQAGAGHALRRAGRGAKTIEVMRRANATALAIDAGRTLLFDRDA